LGRSLRSSRWKAQLWKRRPRRPKNIKNNRANHTHAESKKIAVEVYKNKHDEKSVVNSKSEKVAVKVFI
jgi:hypothetical protein